MSETYYVIFDKKSFFSYRCFAKDKFPPDKEKIIIYDKIDDFTNSNFPNLSTNELVIFWHISGTEDYALDFTEKNRQQIDDKYGKKIILKVGKSQSGTAINEAKELEWFDVAGSGNYILEYFKDNSWDIKKCIDNLPKIKIVDNLKLILELFLPLDIDMHALADKRTTDKRKYLKEMFDDVEDGFYLNKFYETKKLIEDIPDGDNKNKLKTILYIDEGENSCICKFLKLLEDKKKGCAGLTEQDVLEVNSFFRNNKKKTFHDWYWELSTLNFQ